MNNEQKFMATTDFLYIAAVKCLTGIEPVSFQKDQKGYCIAVYAPGASLPELSQIHLVLTSTEGMPVKDAAFNRLTNNYQYYRNKMLTIARNQENQTEKEPNNE